MLCQVVIAFSAQTIANGNSIISLFFVISRVCHCEKNVSKAQYINLKNCGNVIIEIGMFAFIFSPIQILMIEKISSC